VKARLLLEKFKSYDNVINSTDEEIVRETGLAIDALKSLRNTKVTDEIFEKQFDLFEKHKDIQLVTFFNKEYPKNLKNIYDPPLYLFYKGTLSNQDKYSVAVVGSREISTHGRSVTFKLAKELAEKNYIVVSGLAYGVDTIAHRGALEAGKRTVAVLGSGVDKKVNELSEKTKENIINTGGAIFSSFHIGQGATTTTFPVRNRIISGMSLGTLITEAKHRSGSLITAKYAIEQNREVFAVPNQINLKQFEGTNNLIKTGQAKLVMSVKDILNELPKVKLDAIPEQILGLFSDDNIVGKDLKVTKLAEKNENFKTETHRRKSLLTDETEKKIFDLFLLSNEERLNIDFISEQLTIKTSSLLGKLLMLELKKIIVREPNNYFSLASF